MGCTAPANRQRSKGRKGERRESRERREKREEEEGSQLRGSAGKRRCPPRWIQGKMAMIETVTLSTNVLVMKNLFREQLSNCVRRHSSSDTQTTDQTQCVTT